MNSEQSPPPQSAQPASPAQPAHSAIASDDYARTSVPQEHSYSGIHLAMIIISGTIGFAIYVVAAQIGGSLGYGLSAAAFALGSFVLGCMGAVTSYVGARSRLSTYILSEFAFGRHGAKIANMVVAISLIGWFGVISNTLGVAAQAMLAESLGLVLSPYLTVTVASALMIAVTAMGFRGIDKLALYMVPLMIIFIVAAAAKALSASTGEAMEVVTPYTFETAVSAVIGSYIVGVIIQPDFSRFAVSARHAIWSVFVALGIVFPLIQFFSAIPAMSLGEPDVVAVMSLLGFLVPGFILLFFGAWGSNVLCLYSAALSIATFSRRLRLRDIIVAIGIVGTAIAFIPAQSYLVDYLVILGVTIPPIGAIYIIDSMYIRRFALPLAAIAEGSPYRISALLAWASGAGVGYASDSTSFQLVGIAAIDSLIATIIIFVLLERTGLRLKTELAD